MIVGPTSKQEFSKNDIKRVLTLTTEPISEKQKIGGVDYKFLHLLDMPDEPILDNAILETAVLYINEGVEKEENVGVHCLAAVSRSVSICAAYLMYKNQWPVEKALKMIESVRKTIGPNAGFLAQLKIWERSGMSFSADQYKNLKIDIPGITCVDSKTIWRQPVIDDQTKVRFKCRQCRKVIFNSDNIVHPLAEACQKYLIEPMAWLNVSGATCSVSHTCGAKLGTFIASGSKCNGCNKFVRQWIFINRTKLDKVEIAT